MTTLRAVRAKAEAIPLEAARRGVEGATVVVEPLRPAARSGPPAFFESAAAARTAAQLGIGTPAQVLDLPVPAFLIPHPTAGPILVDTGLHPSVATKPARNIGRLAAGLFAARIEPGQDVPSQLRERGIEPDARSRSSC